MSFQILLNVIIAFLWMFFQRGWDMLSFAKGYLIGIIILFLLRRFFPTRFYLARLIAIISLLLLFLVELVKANYGVLKEVIRPTLKIQPGIFALPVEVKKDWEIMLLANLITLTPGTLVVDISDDNDVLYVHSMHIDDVDDLINDIKNSFEKAIMEVSR
jgi:multicomponent Na+:H+ antiporter subunit E